MSIWSTLGGIGLGVAGVATGQPALIGAGVSLAKGGMQASAANKAAKQQTQAAQKAIDYSRQQFGKTEANLQPYADIGRGALSQLSAGMGIPSPSAQPQSSSQFYPTPSGQLTPGMPNQQQAAQALVTLAGPDGSTKQVPAQEVSYWLSKGAKAVPNGPPAGSIAGLGAR